MKKSLWLLLIGAVIVFAVTACTNSTPDGSDPDGVKLVAIASMPDTVDIGRALKLPMPTITQGNIKRYAVKITAVTPSGAQIRANNYNVMTFGEQGEYTVTYELLLDGTVLDSADYDINASHADDKPVLLRGFETEAELASITEIFGLEGGSYEYALNIDSNYVTEGAKSLKVKAKDISVERSDPWPLLSLFGEPKAGTSVDENKVPNIKYVDLSAYAAIEYDVKFVNGAPDFVMNNIMTEMESENWENLFMPVVGQWQHIVIPLSNLSENTRKTLHTFGLAMFNEAAGFEYYIDNIRLTRTIEGAERVLSFQTETDIDKVVCSGASVAYGLPVGEGTEGVLNGTMEQEKVTFVMHSAQSAKSNGLGYNQGAIAIKSLQEFSEFGVWVTNTSDTELELELAIKIGDESYRAEAVKLAPGKTEPVKLSLIDANIEGVDIFSFGVVVGEDEQGFDGYITLTIKGAVSQTFALGSMYLSY